MSKIVEAVSGKGPRVKHTKEHRPGYCNKRPTSGRATSRLARLRWAQLLGAQSGWGLQRCILRSARRAVCVLTTQSRNTRQSMNKPIKQLIKQLINQSINQSTIVLLHINQPSNQLSNQSVDQPANQTVSRLINQPIDQ